MRSGTDVDPHDALETVRAAMQAALGDLAAEARA
jgi:hypothetical protein